MGFIPRSLLRESVAMLSVIERLAVRLRQNTPQLAAGKFITAQWLMISLNLVALTGVVIFTRQQCFHHFSTERGEWALTIALIVAAITIGSPFTATVIWLGQTTIIVVVAVCFAMRFAQEGRYIMAALMMGIASIKPSLMMLPFLWWVFEKRWKEIALTFLWVGLFALWPFFMQGVFGTLTSWFKALQDYAHHPVAYSHSPYVIGLQSFLASIKVADMNLVWLGVLATSLLFRGRHHYNRDVCLGFLSGFTVLFIYSREYDLVYLAPLISALCLRCYTKERAIIIGGLILLLFIPLRVMRSVDFAPIYHWRTIIVLVMTTILAFWGKETELSQNKQEQLSER